MQHTFNKKIYDGKLFFRDVGFLIGHVFVISKAFRNKNISRAFAEKIMNVTTAVNGCVYCAYFHAKQAINSGISKKEVINMMNLQFHADASEYEIMGLLYAQHYAETNRHPDTEMTDQFYNYYGKKTATDILLIIRVIFFGNLCGNTWDAVLSRFKGKPAENSNFIFEFFYFLLSFLFMIPIMLWLKKALSK